MLFISIDVVNTEIRDSESGKKYHIFVLRCQSKNGGSWEVHRRYRNFVTLDAALSSAESWWSDTSNLPPKKIFGHLAVEFVAKRKLALQNYIYNLEKYEPITRNPEFLLFLDPRCPSPADYSACLWWKALKHAHLLAPPLPGHPTQQPSAALFSNVELKQLAAQFRVSSAAPGGLAKQEFSALLSRLCLGYARDILDLIYSASVHLAGTPLMSFGLYLRGLHCLLHGTPSQRAELAFLALDINRDGMLTPDELYSLSNSFEWFARASIDQCFADVFDDAALLRPDQAAQPSCEEYMVAILKAGGADTGPQRRSRKIVISSDHFVRAVLAEPALLSRIGFPMGPDAQARGKHADGAPRTRAGHDRNRSLSPPGKNSRTSPGARRPKSPPSRAKSPPPNPNRAKSPPPSNNRINK